MANQIKKILIGGNNKSMIDDFFNQTEDNFQCMTSSDRYEDIKNHVTIFEPDAYVYCAREESREKILRIIGFKTLFDRKEIPFIFIGEKNEIESFRRESTKQAELEIMRPVTISKITIQIMDMFKQIEDRKKAEEVERGLVYAELESHRRKHILVIDDDITMLKTIKEYLVEDYDVGCAPSGMVGLKFLENKHTDLILLDYEMPNMDGSTVLERIRKNPNTASVPVFFLTGVTDAEKIKKVLAMNPQGYLLKPVSRAKLHETIKKEL